MQIILNDLKWKMHILIQGKILQLFFQIYRAIYIIERSEEMVILLNSQI